MPIPPTESQLISITRADGGVTILTFIIYSPYDSVRHDATDANIDAAITKARIAAVSWRRITAADLPARDYREAWKDTGAGAIGHDMAKARELHRAKLRREREPMLAALDVEYQRADEQSDASGKARIAGRKQRLRDITEDPRIKTATSIEQLAAVRIDARVLDW